MGRVVQPKENGVSWDLRLYYLPKSTLAAIILRSTWQLVDSWAKRKTEDVSEAGNENMAAAGPQGRSLGYLGSCGQHVRAFNEKKSSKGSSKTAEFQTASTQAGL